MNNGTTKMVGLALFLSAAAGCASPHRVGDAGGTQDGSGDPASAGARATDEPQPAWLVGSYEYNGDTSNNILMDHKTIVFANDGTYSGIYCKSCSNKPGKWAVHGTDLVLTGGLWGDRTVHLATEMTSNCRILTLDGKSLHRGSVVPACPLGLKAASGDECSVVGSYSKSTSGTPSRTDSLVLGPDFYFYYSTMSIRGTCYGDLCKFLSNGYERVGTWSLVNGEPSGTSLPDIGGLTFTRGSCALVDPASGSPSGGSPGDAGAPSSAAAPSSSSSSIGTPPPAPTGTGGGNAPPAADAGTP